MLPCWSNYTPIKINEKKSQCPIEGGTQIKLSIENSSVTGGPEYNLHPWIEQ